MIAYVNQHISCVMFWKTIFSLFYDRKAKKNTLLEKGEIAADKAKITEAFNT